MARQVAVLIPRVLPRDYSLPPLRHGNEPALPGPDIASQLSHATDGYGVSDGQEAGEIDNVFGALAWCRERIERGVRIYAMYPEVILGQFLWYERIMGAEFPIISETLDELVEWCLASSFVPLAELVETMVGLTNSQRDLLSMLSSSDDIRSLHNAAAVVDAFIERNLLPHSQEWPDSAADIHAWMDENVNRRKQVGGKRGERDRFAFERPEASTNGLLGTAASIFSLSAGVVLSWHGLNADVSYLEQHLSFDLEGFRAPEREARRKLNAVYTAVRPDRRLHPYYQLQAFKRLEANNPRYQTLSSRSEPNERRAITPDQGDELFSIDVSLAELFITAIYWQRLFRFSHKQVAGQLFDDMEAHVSGAGSDMHTSTGNQLMREMKMSELVGSDLSRKAGKAVNFALGNLGAVKTIAEDQSKKLGMPIDAQAVCHVLRELAEKYPYEAWRDLCRRIAFTSAASGQRRAIVPTITGRWLPIYSRPGNNKPAPTSIASAMTQSSFADVHAFGLFHAVRELSRLKQGHIVGTIYDELLVSAPDEEGAQAARDAYVRGANLLLPRFKVRAEVAKQGAFWSS